MKIGEIQHQLSEAWHEIGHASEQVGRVELTADNALHQLVEDYHELSILSKNILKLADELNKEGK